MNENKNTIHQNSWDAVEGALKRKFIAIETYINK